MSFFSGSRLDFGGEPQNRGFSALIRGAIGHTDSRAMVPSLDVSFGSTCAGYARVPRVARLTKRRVHALICFFSRAFAWS